MGISKQKISNYALLHFSFIIYAFVSASSKMAANSGLFTSKFFLFAILSIVLIGVYAILWQQILGKFPLVTAFSNKGIVVVWNMLLAFFIFNEQITLENIVGGAVIILGIVVVSKEYE